LTKKAHTATIVNKLSDRVKKAKSTLEMHQAHVKEIEGLVAKADGKQKEEL
jgi:hypothetical protein